MINPSSDEYKSDMLMLFKKSPILLFKKLCWNNSQIDIAINDIKEKLFKDVKMLKIKYVKNTKKKYKINRITKLLLNIKSNSFKFELINSIQGTKLNEKRKDIEKIF